MPNRPEFKTYNKQSPSIPQPEPDYGFSGDDFLSGLITDLSSDNIPDNALQGMKNAGYVKEQLFVRNGLRPYSVAKPDSNRVMTIFAFFHATTSINFIRATPTTIYKATPMGWVQFTGGTLHSTTRDFYSFAIADNRCFFSNGGADVIQELDPASNTYSDLGDAPKYRYLTSAYSRLIGANLRAGLPTDIDVPYQIGWSGSLNYDEWDPTVDITAGATPLIESPSDLSDAIVGVFPLISNICVVRQRSIWIGTFVPSGTQPFNFFVAVPRIGCDCPQTIALKADGLVFYNFQQSALYSYVPGAYSDGQPEDISEPVKRAIKSDITDPAIIFSSYNYDTNTYSLFIPNSNTQLVKCYSYNFTNNTWSYEEYNNVSSVDDIDYSSSDLRIIDLSGNISDLVGSIDSLGGLVANSNRFFGFGDGNLSSQPLFAGSEEEVQNIVLTDNGNDINTEFESKTFLNPNFDSYFNTISIEYTPFTTGSIDIFYSKNDGNTFIQYKTITVTTDMLYQTQIILCRKPVRTRRLYWKISSTGIMYSLNNYRVFSELAGLATK